MSETIGCYAALFFSSALSSAAGIGGGAINVPILLFFGHFEYHQAVVLSLCTLLGNLLSQVLINSGKKHPIATSRPMIYWECILVLLPAQLAGSNIGVILSGIIPESVLLIMAMITLLYAGTVTYQKGIKLYIAETKELSSLISSKLPRLSAEESSIESNFEFGSVDSAEVENLIPRSNGSDKKGRAATKKFPWLIVYVTLIVWVLYAILYLILRQFSMCSYQYVAILASIFPILITQIVWGLKFLIRMQSSRSYEKSEGDIDFIQLTALPPVATFCIGVTCALLGIGGGELLGPMFLSFRMLPIVSSATTSMMSLLNTASSMIYYVTLGEVPLVEGSISFTVGVFGGLTGRVLALTLIQRFGRQSLLIFTLAFVLSLSFAMNVYDFATTPLDFSLNSLC